MRNSITFTARTLWLICQASFVVLAVLFTDSSSAIQYNTPVGAEVWIQDPVLGAGYNDGVCLASQFSELPAGNVNINTGSIFDNQTVVVTSTRDALKTMRINALFSVDYKGGASNFSLDSALRFASWAHSFSQRVGVLVRINLITRTLIATNDDTRNRIVQPVRNLPADRIFDFIGREYVHQIQEGAQLYVKLDFENASLLQGEALDFNVDMGFRNGAVNGSASADFSKFFQQNVQDGRFNLSVFAQGGETPEGLAPQIANAIRTTDGSISKVSQAILSAVDSYMKNEATVDRRIVNFSTRGMDAQLGIIAPAPGFDPSFDLLMSTLDRYFIVKDEYNRVSAFASADYFPYKENLGKYLNALLLFAKTVIEPNADPSPTFSLFQDLIETYEDSNGFVITRAGAVKVPGAVNPMKFPDPRFFRWKQLSSPKFGPVLSENRDGTDAPASSDISATVTISSAEVWDPDSWVELNTRSEFLYYQDGGWRFFTNPHKSFQSISAGCGEDTYLLSANGVPVAFNQFNKNGNLMVRARDILDKSLFWKVNVWDSPAGGAAFIPHRTPPEPMTLSYRLWPGEYFPAVTAPDSVGSLNILSPNGGSALRVGDTFQAYWESNPAIDGGMVKIELWRDGQFEALLRDNVANQKVNNIDLTVPAVPDGGGYRVRVVSKDLLTKYGNYDARAYDESNSSFKIQGNLHAVSAVQIGDSPLRSIAGTHQPNNTKRVNVMRVQWTCAANQAGDSIRLELWRAGEKVGFLGRKNAVAGANNMDVDVSQFPSANNYKIRVINEKVESGESIFFPITYSEIENVAIDTTAVGNWELYQ